MVTSPTTSPSPTYISSRGLFRVLWLILGVVAVVYAAAYADLVLRARSAYLEGEKYMQWYGNPGLKAAYYDRVLNRERARLGVEKAAGRMSEAEYQQRLILAQFEHDDAIKESSLKYAYHWYQTASELFSPPESRWVRLSREKMAEVKRLWKQELDAAKIPYQDYMLE